MIPSIPLPLEDSHLDILGKAQRGLLLTDAALIARAGISANEFAQIQAGEVLPAPLAALAAALNLGPHALAAAAANGWRPAPVATPGLQTFTTDFEDMTVNSYLVWDAVTSAAVAFDTGASVGSMLEFAAAKGLNIGLILITHTHEDHIMDLGRLRAETGAPAWLGDGEPALAGVLPFAVGKSFQVGVLTIETRLTSGHAEGGITYVVSGLARPIAIVGDAIFAGSMGGGKVSYAAALRSTRDEILSLPGDTILAPGHGPLTTVAEQNAHNPFFSI